MTLPTIYVKFEDVEAAFVATPKMVVNNAFTCELTTGEDKRLEYGKLTLRQTTGGTWRDYLDEEETLETWLRSQSINQSKHKALIIDTLNPIAVLASKNETLCRDAYIIAVTADETSTPAEKNASYAVLRALHAWKTPITLATETYTDNLTAFDEEHGLLRGKRALNRIIKTIIEEIGAFSQFMDKDKSLGIETHTFSALQSANERVYRNADSAIQDQIKNTSTHFDAEDVLSVRLLAYSHWRRFTEIEKTYKHIRERYPNLIDSEIRLREKQTRHELYDAHIFFGLKRDPVLPLLKEGYDTVAKRVPQLRLEAHT